MQNQKIEELTAVPGKNTVRVQVGDLDFEIASASVSSLELETGQPVTPALRKQLEAAAHRRAAASVALKFLKGRPRTESEVRRYLLDKEHSDLAVTAVLEELRTQGLVNDQRYAEWYVEARLAHRPTGAMRLVHEMVARGLPKEIARAAADVGVRQHDEVALATKAAEKRLPMLRGLERERALRRLSAFLTTRGFRQETVRSVSLKLLEGQELEEPSGRFA